MANGAPEEEVKELRQELRDLRHELEKYKTDLDGRFKVIDERTNNLRVILLSVVIPIVTTVIATLLLRAILGT